MAEATSISAPIRILFFAQAREQTKLRESSITFSKVSLKPRELLAGVIENFPGLKPLEKCIILAKNRSYLDFDSEEEVSLRPEDELAVIPPISAVRRKILKMDLVKLVTDKINVEELVDSVGCESCGATSVFVGTTRDNFENKKVIIVVFGCGAISVFVVTNWDNFETKRVVRLEYEAYEPMAIDEMKKICTTVRGKWQVQHIAFVHRLGLVPVKEASIVVAISSPHRKESLEAVQFAIDALKTSVPIWKKEVYDNENESKWKANPECAWKENNRHASESCS